MISELCGAMAGDGWIQSNESGLFLTGDPINDKDYYDGHICILVSKILSPVKPRYFHYWGVYGIALYKKKDILKLLEFGVPKGKKVSTVEIPKWVLDSKDKIIGSFIRGLFDTDGGVCLSKDYTKYASNFRRNHHIKLRLRFTSVSSKLIEQTFNCMQKLGFRCLLIYKQSSTKNVNTKDVYMIEINELRSIHKFFNDIKPSNPKHTTKYKIWLKYGFCPTHTTLNQRLQILNNKLDPKSFYERNGGEDS